MNENTRKIITETIHTLKAIRNCSIFNMVLCVIGLERFQKLDVYSFDYIKTFDFSPGNIAGYILLASFVGFFRIARTSVAKINELKNSISEQEDIQQ